VNPTRVIQPTEAELSAAPTPTKSRLNIVLFSGGSGTQSITQAFLRHPQIALTIIINAYDDGHSTGRLRRFIPRMLGPSDVRKNINRLMPTSERAHLALRHLSDYRLPVGIPEREALPFVDALVRKDAAALPLQLRDWFEQLPYRQVDRVAAYCGAFREYLNRQRDTGRSFDFTDCALGNIFFAGCFLDSGRDFNESIRVLSDFYEIDSTILNVTQGENLFLVAQKEDGSMLLSEEAIVSAQSSAKINRVILIGEELYRSEIEPGVRIPLPELKTKIDADARFPEINPEADAAIRTADLIIYGPGTQHSSLFPSYLTRGVGEAIAANTSADKIFISNIERDFDIQGDDAGDLASKLLRALAREGAAAIEYKDVVTHFFCHDSAPGPLASQYVPFDKNSFQFPLDSVKLRDWEHQAGKHAGDYVFEELQNIVQSRMGIAIRGNRYLVSIVVPAWNEVRTIEATLKHLMALDFTAHELSKEIVVVDGGSTDGTLEKAQSVRGVKVFQLDKEFGRGAAIRLGIAKSRGDLIVTFPADDEYRAQDVFTLVMPIIRNEFNVVFGTRSTKCFSLTEQLKSVYGQSSLMYLTSKYGGMLLSTLTLFLYNKYVTDSLTSLKAYDGRLLRSLDLRSKGVDLDMEIIAKLARRNQYILEIPVEFRPRTRAEGKKTSLRDGLSSIAALVRYRLLSS
jgi:2-phospho-L-lactate transferase/gluconeogenesis factor (CofD/UPF0052 family)